MGIFDKAKDALTGHEAQVDTGIDKAGDLVDERTGGKYVSQVDKGQEVAKEQLDKYLAREETPAATPPAAEPTGAE